MTTKKNMEHKNDASLLRKQVANKKKFSSVQREKSSKAKGDSGQYQFQLNDVTSEFDANLMGRGGSVAFSEMSKSDGIIGGLLSAYVSLILSCKWTIGEISEITPDEEKVQTILKQWLFEYNNFDQLLFSILKMLPLGFSVFNKYLTPFKFQDDYYMMPVLLERLQKSVWRIDYEKEFIEQITSTGSIVEIPFKDLVFFTFRQEGIDLRGVSLLRQAYYDWQDKKEIKNIAKKGVVREMLGLPIGKTPQGVNVDSPEFQDFATLLEMLSSRTALDTDDSIIIPDKYSLEMFKTDFKINEVKEYLNYFDSSMAISVLTQFILLGQQGGGGSYSLGSDQSSFFQAGLQYIMNYVCKQINKEVIIPTVKMNWVNVDPTRFKLKAINLDNKATEIFAKSVKMFIDSGMLNVQKSDEQRIRDMYGFEPIDEKEREEAKEREKNDDTDPDDNPDSPSSDDQEVEEEESSQQMSEVPVVTFYKTAKQREAYIDQEVKALTKYSKASLRIVADKLLASIRWQLTKGSTQAQGLKDVQLNSNAVASYKKNMGQKIAAITKHAWDVAKSKAAPHLKALSAQNPSDLPTKTLTSFVINQSDLSVEKQVNDLRESSLLIANTASAKGYKVEQVLAQVEVGVDKYIDSAQNAELANMTSITQAASYGELQYYKSIDDSLWGYRFENVAPKTQICISTVGKVYHKDSAEMEMMSPPLHFRCKSFFEPVYKDEAKPDFDDYLPPPSIMKDKTM